MMLHKRKAILGASSGVVALLGIVCFVDRVYIAEEPKSTVAGGFLPQAKDDSDYMVDPATGREFSLDGGRGPASILAPSPDMRSSVIRIEVPVKSTAVVFPEPNRVVVEEVTCPDPGPDDVVVDVTHSWISNGTEGSFLRGERIAGDTAYRDGDPWPFPIVAGYQKIGTVRSTGQAVTDLVVGETVFCALGKVDGMFQDRGGHVSPSVSPRDQIWKLGPDVDPQACAGLVLTQVGYNCGTRAPVSVGDGAVVIGDGLVGHWAAQTLAWRGASVVMVGRHDRRLAKFAAPPFSGHTVNSRTADWPDAVQRRLPRGARVTVDTVGSIAAVDALLPLMTHRGHVVSAGFYGTEDRLGVQALRSGELSLDTVSGWSQDRMDATLALVRAGYLQTLPLVTHRFPVHRADQAWSLIQSKREPVLGVILEWTS